MKLHGSVKRGRIIVKTYKEHLLTHASPIAINDKLQSLCPLSLCPNYCLYAVTVGVADGVVADAVDILCLSLFIFSFCPFVFLSDPVWMTLKHKN